MDDFSGEFKGRMARVTQRLLEQDIEGLARRVGLLRRRERKVSPQQLLLALLSVAVSSPLTCENIASALRLLIGTRYSKQAVHKRISAQMSSFLKILLASVFAAEADKTALGGAGGVLRRVLVHDSTSVPLPPRYAESFPGSGNQLRQRVATMKIQLICDLLSDSVLDLSVSGFTRNDQSASADVLAVARRGDLVLRDLGYFVLGTFRRMDDEGIFYLSRWRHDVTIRDAHSGQPIDLARLLRRQRSLDIPCLLGSQERLPARIVAIQVPPAVAAMRRRKARNNRNQSCNPGPKSLFLRGWSIYVTNLPPSSFSATQVDDIYKLRWRIETIFKAWKSHIGLNDLHTGNETMLQISVMTKLIYCALTNATCQMLDRGSGPDRQASLLRVARIMKDCGWLIAAALLDVHPLEMLCHIMHSHAFYERRRDRRNMKQLIEAQFLG